MWRRLRGALGLATVWGAAGALFGAGLAIIEAVQFGSLVLFQTTLSAALGFGILGFISGGAFAGVFSLAEHQRSFDEISVGRAAGWGFVTGALLTAGFIGLMVLNPSVYVGGTLGALLGGTAVLSSVAGSVVGSLAACTMLIARAAPDDDARLGAGDEPRQLP